MSPEDTTPLRVTKPELLYRGLLRPLSVDRLSAYSKGAADPERLILARYLWNVSLCEAFYPILHVLEISLRNAIFQALSSKYPGTGLLDPVIGRLDSWLDRDPAVSRLEAWHQAQVADAKASIGKQSKPLTEGALVAELGFGFWTGLFGTAYGDSAPSDMRPWPTLLPHVFPNSSPKDRRRAFIADELNRIRILRNRVFHHEPIWRRNAKLDQRDILRVIGWMSREAEVVARHASRLPVVASNSIAPHELSLRAISDECYPPASAE